MVVLRNNAFLEAVVFAAVVIADAGYRRLCRGRRARTSQPRARYYRHLLMTRPGPSNAARPSSFWRIFTVPSGSSIRTPSRAR